MTLLRRWWTDRDIAAYTALCLAGIACYFAGEITRSVRRLTMKNVLFRIRIWLRLDRGGIHW